jgi:hypothetical protein
MLSVRHNYGKETRKGSIDSNSEDVVLDSYVDDVSFSGGRLLSSLYIEPFADINCVQNT